MNDFLPGQYIQFAIQTQSDVKYPDYTYYYVKKGKRTFMKIAADLGRPELAADIAELNGERNRFKMLPLNSKVRVPGTARPGNTFKVLAGDNPPTIIDGYATWDVVDRSQRTGLTVFKGYPPIKMSVPIRFEAYLSGTMLDGEPYNGAQVERDITLLERMAGRGAFVGAAVGPPPVLVVSTRNEDGGAFPLIPYNYQVNAQNKTPPTWVITGLTWDDGALRDDNGLRIRQLATVELTQFVGAPILRASATDRHNAKTITATRAIRHGNTVTYTNVPKGGFSGP